MYAPCYVLLHTKVLLHFQTASTFWRDLFVSNLCIFLRKRRNLRRNPIGGGLTVVIGGEMGGSNQRTILWSQTGIREALKPRQRIHWIPPMKHSPRDRCAACLICCAAARVGLARISETQLKKIKHGMEQQECSTTRVNHIRSGQFASTCLVD